MNDYVAHRRPGGRTERTRAAVHAALRELLAASGGALPSLAEIADQSGVHLATIYRRWGTARALVLDIAVEDLDTLSPITVTGELRNDLLTYARELATGVAAPEGLAFLRTLIATATDGETGRDDVHDLTGRRLDRYQEILDAGASRVLTPMDVVDNLLAPIYLRALLGEPVPAEGAELERLVDNLLAIDRSR